MFYSFILLDLVNILFNYVFYSFILLGLDNILYKYIYKVIYVNEIVYIIIQLASFQHSYLVIELLFAIYYSIRLFDKLY